MYNIYIYIYIYTHTHVISFHKIHINVNQLCSPKGEGEGVSPHFVSQGWDLHKMEDFHHLKTVQLVYEQCGDLRVTVSV